MANPGRRQPEKTITAGLFVSAIFYTLALVAPAIAHPWLTTLGVVGGLAYAAWGVIALVRRDKE